MGDIDPNMYAKTVRTILDDSKNTWNHALLNGGKRLNADWISENIKKYTDEDVGLPEDDSLEASQRWWGRVKEISDDYAEKNKHKPYDLMNVVKDRADMTYPNLGLVDAGNKFRDSIGNILETESNLRANRDWKRKRSDGSNATVFVDKKNQNQAHVDAGRTSAFARDFGHIEVDNDVDLKHFKQLGSEYEKYEKLLPAAHAVADLRFRYTGRHRATGTYHPEFRNIAVDPRHPASFTHEYFHHLDATTANHDLSLDPEFKPILDHYRRTVDTSQMAGSNPDRYLAPTEVFARCAETWMSRHGGDGSSFLEPKETYGTRFDYAPFKDQDQQIDRFFGRLFG